MKNTRICARDSCDRKTRRKEKKYCSDACWKLVLYAGETYPQDRECQECRETFSVTFPKREQRFCNRSCAATHTNRGTKRGPSRPKCLGCDNLAAKYSVYCSVQCKKDHKIRLWLSGEIIPKSIPSNSKTHRPYIWEDQDRHCALCPQGDAWMGQRLGFILDHIDGNSEDNRRENLRLVCPNCDSQLPTYKAKNTGNGRHYRRERYAEGKSY